MSNLHSNQNLFFASNEPIELLSDDEQNQLTYGNPGYPEIRDDLDRPFASTSHNHLYRISVQRNDISSTTVQEGDEELRDLNVEAYDQQTYEQGIFDQVNKTISTAEKNDKSIDGQPDIKSQIRIIYSERDADAADNCETDKQDENVLKLARLQRFNRKFKTEPIENPESQTTVPKIPTISSSRRCDVANTLSKQPKSPSHPEISRSFRSRKIKRDPDIDGTYESHASDDFPSSDFKTSEYEGSVCSDDYDEQAQFESDSDEPGCETEKKSKKRKLLEDDGDFKCFQARIKEYSRARAAIRLGNILEDGTESKQLDELVQIEEHLHIPKELWDNLFEHQKTGVRWLWELHELETGGILGDEMGLGKTIQMIAFLAALKNSSIPNRRTGYKNLGPVILVCPATVMHQWLLEFRKWWPPFRVAILHSTGTFSGDRKNLVQIIHKSCGILIVSYPGVVIYQDQIHNFDWHYAILDEGHKIRNPDAQVTLACKRFRTPHRIILSGSPVQNNLKELWSIFDFISPGKLGTLPVFMQQFAIPITQGGYANASDIQVQIAYKCSCILRDTIKPFLLRRTKAEVNHILKLPNRSEQVLFCKLTDKQLQLYKSYLESPTIRDIKRGVCQVFVGLTQLRKICNHPDLFDSSECKRPIKVSQESAANKVAKLSSENETFGYLKKSGKMMVVDALLKLWKKQSQKVLLFTQSRQMLKIFRRYLQKLDHKYLVMDGETPIGIRQAMIHDFNTNEEYFIFLLTTRVGGVGINLTAANRIIIYDPDWNPSTDIQARERAWRIGQQRHVIIYRLLTAGTIEEKIYHRQVFKLYLTNRILRDSKQKRFFKTNDLHELFTLGNNDKNIETKALFDDDLQINLDSINKSKQNAKKKRKSAKRELIDDTLGSKITFSDEKLKEMRERARKLSQMISCQYGSQTSDLDQAKIKIEPNTTETSLTDVKMKLEPSNNSLCFEESRSMIRKSKVVKQKTDAGSRQTMEYLVKQDVYQPDGDDRAHDPRCKRDDYILQRLFKNSSISGALKHDKIETDLTPDFKVIESEAEKVARDAIRALRESRRLCSGSSSGVPNWTGRNGKMAARPRLQTKNMSKLYATTKSEPSAEGSLLLSIKKRNQMNPTAFIHDTFAISTNNEELGDKDFEGKAEGTGADIMISKIRDFVLFNSSNPGTARTEELLDFFKSNFRADKTSVFKSLLYKMCEFQRRGDKGFWSLKSEFRHS